MVIWRTRRWTWCHQQWWQRWWDVSDGTGLADATDPSGLEIWPLINLFGQYDIIGTGNHELYLNDNIEGARDGLYSKCGHRCLTSNIVWSDSKEPLGARYNVVVGAAGSRVMGLGFLFNFKSHGSAVEVTEVQEALAMPWFVEAMSIKVRN